MSEKVPYAVFKIFYIALIFRIAKVMTILFDRV